MEWTYQGKEFTSDDIGKHYGFIYIITNKMTGQRYLGRKFFTKSHTRQVKGKKKKSRVESDWKSYWSSSKELIDMVTQSGEENFTREIVRLCETLGETKYWETKLMFQYEVLESKLEDGSFEWLNGNVMMKYTRKNIGKF